MNFWEWVCEIATLPAYKFQIHMLLRLELRLEISIKYNLSITFAPKTLSLLVSPSLFFFIYLFCVVFELLRFLMSFALAKFIFKPFYGWFFYAPQPHNTITVLCRDFRLLKIWNVFFVFARNRQSNCPNKKKRKLINAKVHWQKKSTYKSQILPI